LNFKIEAWCWNVLILDLILLTWKKENDISRSLPAKHVSQTGMFCMKSISRSLWYLTIDLTFPLTLFFILAGDLFFMIQRNLTLLLFKSREYVKRLISFVSIHNLSTILAWFLAVVRNWNEISFFKPPEAL